MKPLPSSWTLPTLVVLYSLNYMDRSVLAAVTEAMRADLGLNDMQMGLIHSILLIALMLILIPCATMCDVAGRRRMLTLATSVWSVGVFLTGTAASFLQLLAARMCTSFNDGFAGSGGSSWVSVAYPPEKRGRMLGFFHMSSPLGMTLGTLFGGLVLTLFGSWRACFLAMLVPAAGLVFLLPRLPDPEKPAGLAGLKPYVKGMRQMIFEPAMLVNGVAVGFFTMLLMTYQSWMPTLLIRSYGLSAGAAGAMFAGMVLAGMAGPVLGGMLADWWKGRAEDGRPRAAAFAMLVLAVEKSFFYGTMGSFSPTLTLVFGLVDGIVTVLPIPIYFALVQDIVPARYRNLSMGVMGAICFLTGGAWGPLCAGVLSEWFGGGADGLRMAMLLLLGFAVVAAALFWKMCPVYLRRKREVEAMEP